MNSADNVDFSLNDDDVAKVAMIIRCQKILIKQSNPRNEISMISFVCFGTGGQVRTREKFFHFSES